MISIGILLALFSTIHARSSGAIGIAPGRNISSTPGKCKWSECGAYCPIDFIEVRRSANSTLPKGKTTYVDHTFGSACTTGEKYLCCRPETSNCLWQGLWVNSYNQKITCSFQVTSDSDVCGYIFCNSHGIDNRRSQRSEIKHSSMCNDVELFGLYGKGTCGSIHWSDNKYSHDSIVDTWYKII